MNSRNAFYALAVLGGYFAWRNRFAIQRQLESLGVKTPILEGNLGDKARSVISKVSGKVDRASNVTENQMQQKFGT